ncbi:MAG TPA: PAS domain-containing protein, partial [Acidobacteriota bacterium]|nr:PAS domain-containing protein [Acidobacteriota bacterium]
MAAATVDSAIYDWDLETQQVNWTEGITKLFGYSMAEVDRTDQWWIDHVHPEDRSGVLREIDVKVKKARDFCVEYRFLSKDNQYRTVQDRGLIVRNRKGRAIRVVGSVSDITERKLAEETMKLLIEVVSTASESQDIHALTANCLEKICILRRWQIGQAWFVDENEDKIFCSHSFYSEIDVTELRRLSLQCRVPKGV